MVRRKEPGTVSFTVQIPEKLWKRIAKNAVAAKVSFDQWLAWACAEAFEKTVVLDRLDAIEHRLELIDSHIDDVECGIANIEG
jgi:hypothetical protein